MSDRIRIAAKGDLLNITLGELLDQLETESPMEIVGIDAFDPETDELVWSAIVGCGETAKLIRRFATNPQTFSAAAVLIPSTPPDETN